MHHLPDPIRLFLTDLADIPEVEALLLAGSQTAATTDQHSDHDVYVYSSQPVPEASRRAVFEKHGAQMEVSNTFWELEDDGYIGSAPIELIYRSWDWLEHEMERTVVRCEPWIGFTTCFWDNFIRSRILFDRTGRATALQKKYTVPYPEQLKHNIIQKNLPLLKAQMPNYLDQVKKAILRDDVVSINHRVAAFLASYFDILFALNHLPHPGEKKLIRIVKERCALVPKHFEEDVRAVTLLNVPLEQVPVHLERMTDELEGLVGG